MSGLSLIQVKKLIIKPVLDAFPARYARPYNLLLGTLLVESGGVYIKQLGGGPALGPFEMELATHNDCYNNFLRYPANAALLAVVKSTLGSGVFSGAAAMEGNFYYAAAMARVKYIRVDAPLPSETDAAALAAYHKDWYNTADGATDVSESEALFAQAIAVPDEEDADIA